MQSIFRYPGGKTRSTIQRWILGHRPAGVREYREPFVGGGGVFFALKPSSVERRWVNDAHAGLVAVYLALAERPEEFARLCRGIEPARTDDPLTGRGVEGGKAMNARLKAVFESLKLDENCDQALRYFFVNRTVFAGRVNYDRESRLYFSKPEGWDVVKGRQLEDAARWVVGARITCGDFGPLFSEPGEGVWVYADPPYYRDTGFTGNSKLYQYGFTTEDHERLARAVRESPHRVCVSYDDDPDGYIRSLYQGDQFYIEEDEWAYCGSTNATKDRGKELLILNYPPPNRLFPTRSGVKGELARHEAFITKREKAFVEAGLALRAIRDGRLYRETAPTFDDYCESRWGFERRFADRLIDSADVFGILQTSPIGLVLPDSESQARQLARLRDEDGDIDAGRVATVWGRIVEKAEAGDRPITAAVIREEVERELSPAPTTTPAPATDPLAARLIALPAERLVAVLRSLHDARADARPYLNF